MFAELMLLSKRSPGGIIKEERRMETMKDWLFVEIDHEKGQVRVIDYETENTTNGYGPFRGQVEFVNQVAHSFGEKHGYEVRTW